jgi:hypothetical protein
VVCCGTGVAEAVSGLLEHPITNTTADSAMEAQTRRVEKIIVNSPFQLVRKIFNRHLDALVGDDDDRPRRVIETVRGRRMISF